MYLTGRAKTVPGTHCVPALSLYQTQVVGLRKHTLDQVAKGLFLLQLPDALDLRPLCRAAKAAISTTKDSLGRPGSWPEPTKQDVAAADEIVLSWQDASAIISNEETRRLWKLDRLLRCLLIAISKHMDVPLELIDGFTNHAESVEAQLSIGYSSPRQGNRLVFSPDEQGTLAKFIMSLDDVLEVFHAGSWYPVDLGRSRVGVLLGRPLINPDHQDVRWACPQRNHDATWMVSSFRPKLSQSQPDTSS